MSATVAGIEAPGGQRLAVGQEGHVKATTSTFSRLRAPVSLIGPSRAVADTSVDKTAWARAGQGSRGFGLLGAGAAQASATTAIGFGYFGGAMNVYDVFFAGGSNVELPVNHHCSCVWMKRRSHQVEPILSRSHLSQYPETSISRRWKSRDSQKALLCSSSSRIRAIWHKKKFNPGRNRRRSRSDAQTQKRTIQRIRHA